MKKLLLFLIVFGFLFGCSHEQRITNLEAKLLSFNKKDVMLLAEQAGARKFWWRNTLLGNTSESLDGISHTVLTDGDVAIVATLSGTTSTFYLYVYDSDGTNSDSPTSCTTECTRIKVDSGTGAWQLAQFYTAKMTSTASDGYRYIYVANSGDFAGTPAEGYCYYRTDTHTWCCYDGSTWDCEVMP